MGFSPQQPRSSGEEEFWSERDFIGFYDQPYDNSSENDNCADERSPDAAMEDGSLRTSGVNGNVQSSRDAAVFEDLRMMSDFEAFTASWRGEQSQALARNFEAEKLQQDCGQLGQTHGEAQRPTKGIGWREKQHRVQKPEQRGQRKTTNR